MSASNYQMTPAQKKALAADVRAAEKAFKSNSGNWSNQQTREMEAFIHYGKKGRDIRNEGGYGA